MNWRVLLSRPQLLALAVLLLSAAAARTASLEPELDDDDDASIAGPVVKSKGLPPAITFTVNETDIKKKTIAQMIDEALEQEFPEAKEEAFGKTYNETAKQADASVETVIKISQNKKEVKDDKEKKEDKEKDAKETSPGGKGDKSQKSAKKKKGGIKERAKLPKETPQQTSPLAKKDKEKHQHLEVNMEQDVDRIIDAQDNEYVLSRPKGSSVGLTLDPQLIRDLTVLVTSSTIAGMAMEAIKQPVINGYFIAGSLVGPGGLQLIKELVQVESLAQIGVQLLLFTLGLEFTLSKLRPVRSVALIGGMVEIFLFILAAGIIAKFIGASVHEGIFVGALVSMSSTSIVVKCLHDTKTTNLPHGQITIGTLILQDCMVGLLFAFMPVLANRQGEDGMDRGEVLALLARVTLSLAGVLVAAFLLARTLLPPASKLLSRTASPELFQLTILSFCLSCAWLTGHLGLSTELGAFVAGVMLSATEQQEACLSHLEQVKHLFMALFIASTGLIMSPRFVLQHLPVLTGGVLLCIAAKTVLISGVVWMFRYPYAVALAVGINMAQIGEFAFVLLSVASQLGLMPYQVYMLLMGVTALSLLVTPFLLQASNRWLHLPKNEDRERLPLLQKKHRTNSMDVGNTPPANPASPHNDNRMNADARFDNSDRHRKPSFPAGASAYPSEMQLQQRGNAFQ